MKKLLVLFLVLLTASIGFAGVSPKVSASSEQIANIDYDDEGTPTFIVGNLGKLGPGSVEQSSKAFMKANKNLFHAQGSEDFEHDGNNNGIAAATRADQLGHSHVRLAQTIHGLPVAGGELIVHSDSTGKVFAINGRFALDKNLPRTPQIDGATAVAKAAAQSGIKSWTSLGTPTLTYVVTEKSQVHLAWVVRASYTDRGPQIDKIYADAITGNLVMTAPEVYYAENRATYDANHGGTLPGTLRISEGGANTGDLPIDDAHNFAGSVYDFYRNVHGRDSYDNAGAQIVSSAHYLTNYNNAFWDGSLMQMAYGDGDGVTFRPFSEALDVDAHELSHAVTQNSGAQLIYSNESGALNEANSDIQGNSCEAYTRNAWTPNANTWMVGEDIYIAAGQAIRYMDDPARDGSSSDWYPTRYIGPADFGGVHWNSGIANLAFYKWVMGGTHPRGKSTVNVTPLSTNPSIAMEMASRIQYRALTAYFIPTTNFQMARTWTAQAASDLYGAAAAATVQASWDLVGVPVPPDFAISASPTSVSVAQGSAGTSAITTTVSGGFNNAVSLSASGAPAGASVSFDPASIAAPGSGSSTMTINAGAATAPGTYTITVTGSGGTLTHTATVTLTVVCVPAAISSQPTSSPTTITPGAFATLSIGVTGPSPTITWYTGATGDTSNPSVGSGTSITVSPSVTTTYWARVSNTCGSQDSSVAQVTVCTVAAISSGPTSNPTTITPPAAATLSIGVSGTSPTVQWYTSSDTFVGSGNPITVAPSVTTTYYATVANACTPTIKSPPVTVNVCIPAAISSYPISNPGTLTTLNGSATLSIGVTGTSPTVQWFTASGTPVGNGTQISVTPSVNTTYYATVGNACQATFSSQPQTATVNICPPTLGTGAKATSPITAGQTSQLQPGQTTGASPLTYSWYKSDGTFIGSTPKQKFNVTPTVTTSYYYIVSNSCGTTAPSPTLTVVVQ